MDNHFAHVPTDAESPIAVVMRQAEEECLDDQLPPLALDRCVREAVVGLRGSRITTYVPLLALRRVRCCVRARTCDCDDR
jgi:hypothetical protein